MSFGSKRLDDNFDRWITQTPEEYFGTENDEDDEPKKKRKRRKKCLKTHR